jgi:hypothetical protein
MLAAPALAFLLETKGSISGRTGSERGFGRDPPGKWQNVNYSTRRPSPHAAKAELKRRPARGAFPGALI